MKKLLKFATRGLESWKRKKNNFQLFYIDFIERTVGCEPIDEKISFFLSNSLIFILNLKNELFVFNINYLACGHSQ